jgi:hypothetical protein
LAGEKVVLQLGLQHIALGLRRKLSITWRKSIRRYGPLTQARRSKRGKVSTNWLRRNRSNLLRADAP